MILVNKDFKHQSAKENWIQHTDRERLQEIGMSPLQSIGPFSAFCTPDIAPEGFPVIILYLGGINAE